MADSKDFIELGLRLAQFLNTGKQPCKYSDRLWEIAIKLLDTPPTIKFLEPTDGDNK